MLIAVFVGYTLDCIGVLLCLLRFLIAKIMINSQNETKNSKIKS